MHWTRQVIALKAQSRTLQIFDLEQKQKLKSTTMNEDVVFWKWISETTLGMVTDSSVYHWDVFDASQAAPVKAFDRNSNLQVCGHPPWSNPSSLTIPRTTKSSTTALALTENGWLSLEYLNNKAAS